MGQKSKILVVDDQPEQLQSFMELMKECDEEYNMVVASNGEIACEIAKKELPDLIVMDWDMPLMNGLEATKCLRMHSETKDIPIVITTGVMMSSQDMKNAFEAGATEYLRKPIEGVELITRVRSMLQLSQKYKEVKANEKELEKQNLELKEKNEELDAFSHTVAHDLKNPLNTILSYLGFLKEEYAVLSTEQRENYFNGVEKVAMNMAKIIDELLLLSMVRSVDDMFLLKIDSKSIIQKVLAQYDELLKEKKSEIVLQEKFHEATGYAAWVEEVWSNFISNTIKYGGDPLKIEIGSEIIEDEVCFWIKDNGMGISSEDQEIIFDKFTRINKTKAEGSGLGLSIVSRIVRKLGGNVNVESIPGKWTKFSFTLPVVSETINS